MSAPPWSLYRLMAPPAMLTLSPVRKLGRVSCVTTRVVPSSIRRVMR